LRYFWSVNIVTDATEVAHDDGADAAIGALLQYIHRDGVAQVRPPGGPLSINLSDSGDVASSHLTHYLWNQYSPYLSAPPIQ
jgi:hypothetical protein